MPMTITYNDSGLYRQIICDFVAVTGAASATTRRISGRLVKMTTDPGSPAPTDNWDVVVTDSDGVNVLAQCANAAALIARDTTTTEETYLNLLSATIPIASGPSVNDVLTIAVANAGSGAGQIIFIWTPL